MYFLRFKQVGTLDWCRLFPTPCANEAPASSALSWPMAYRPWAVAELTRRRPFVGTGRLVIIRRKLPSDQVTVEFCKAFFLLWNGGSIQRESFSYFLEVLELFWEPWVTLLSKSSSYFQMGEKKSLVQSGSSWWVMHGSIAQEYHQLNKMLKNRPLLIPTYSAGDCDKSFNRRKTDTPFSTKQLKRPL